MCILYGIIISGQSVSIARADCSDYQPESTEQIIETFYNPHRTPCTAYNAYAFYPERTKKPPKLWTKQQKPTQKPPEKPSKLLKSLKSK